MRAALPGTAGLFAHSARCALSALVAVAPAAQARRRRALASADGPPTGAGRYAGRADTIALAVRLAAQFQLDPGWTLDTLAQARFLPVVPRLIMPPPKGTLKNWAAYRARFIEPQRIRAGAAFWRANARWFDAAQERYGVPAALIAGIIGVETFYGRIMGNFRVLDALATLSLDFPTGRSDRSAFFQDELGQLLAWSRREGFDPAEVQGSFAGAIGLGQFMPGSINRHAVDFDGDGRIDLINSAADAIGSVANFLRNHGWQPGLPTHFAVQPPADLAERALLLVPDIVPCFSAAQMAEHGALLDDAGRLHDGPLALVELINGGNSPSYVAGTQNFYAVTRYNWSSYYALAVIELGQAVAAAVAAA